MDSPMLRGSLGRIVYAGDVLDCGKRLGRVEDAGDFEVDMTGWR